MGKYIIDTLGQVEDFINSLDKVRKGRVDRFYYLFEEYGLNLPSNYLKKLCRDVWELRPGDVRLFLTIKDNHGVIVHGIYKKSQKTPKRDLDLAKERIRRENL